MVSPMSRVNSLVSADIGNYLTNKETWSSILFNVKAYGAKGDGVTDDTAKIQAALNAADNAGGGIVFCPRGLYLLKSQITIPKGIVLHGISSDLAPQWVAGVGWEKSKYGTVFSIDWGSGGSSVTNSAVLMSSYSKIIGCSFWYPNQSGDTTTPVQYPPTVAHINGDSEQSASAVVETEISDCVFVNPWIAMDFTRSHILLNVYKVKFSAWKKGLIIDESTDVDRIIDVHSNPSIMYRGSWPTNNVYVYGLNNGGIGFEIGRADQIYFARCFVYGFNVSFKMAKIGVSNPSGLFMEQCGFEYGNYAMIINGPVRRIKMVNMLLSSNTETTGQRALQIALPIDAIIDEINLTQVTVFLSALQGMYLENIKNLIMDNCSIYDACSVNQAFEVAALYMQNCSGFAINGIHINANSGNPLAIEATITNCNGFSISNMFLSGQSRPAAADLYVATSSNGVINQGFLTAPYGTGFQKDGSSPTVTIGTTITY